MESSIFVLLLVQIVLIALNAIFAEAEIAVLSVNDAKLERMAAQGNRKARRLQKVTAEPERFLSTIQIAITLSGFLGSAFAADGFSEPLVEWAIALGAAFEALGMVLGDGVYNMSLDLPGVSARILKVEGHKIVEAELIMR